MNPKLTSLILLKCIILLNLTNVQAQDSRRNVNMDEAKVQPYQLPDVLTFANGKSVSSKKKWERKRRPEILHLFKDEVYGNVPDVEAPEISYQIVEEGDAYDGQAIRRQVVMSIHKGSKTLDVNLLIYLPVGVDNPPLFLGYNYYGNQSITADPKVLLPQSWVNNNEQFLITENKATEASRNKRGYRWAIEMMLEEGFGLACMYYGDIDPDRKGHYADGIHPLFYQNGRPNEAQPPGVFAESTY